MLLTFVTFGTKTGKFSGLSNISKTFSTGAPTSNDFVIFGIDVPPRDPAASRKVGVSLFGIASVSGGRYIQVSCPRLFHRSRSRRPQPRRRSVAVAPPRGNGVRRVSRSETRAAADRLRASAWVGAGRPLSFL